LPTGQKKVDLLQELEKVIERGTNSVSETYESKVDDNFSVTSAGSDSNSIFSESEEENEGTITDSSSVSSSGGDSSNEKPTATSSSHELSFEKDLASTRIENSLYREPAVKEEELEAENRDWSQKLKAASSLKEIYRIETKVNIDIKNKRRFKQQSAELDNIIESIPSLFENQSANNSENFNKALQNINNSLGEEKNNEVKAKAEKAKKSMIEHDPEKYFENFAR
jgi:hypothetical protein